MRFCFESRKKLCLVTTRVAPAMVHTDGVLAINGYHERALRTRSCAKSQVVQAEHEEFAPLTRACGQRYGRDRLDSATTIGVSLDQLWRLVDGVYTMPLFRMSEALADGAIERHRRRLQGRARLVTIDLDPTDDPTHGAQQLTGNLAAICRFPPGLPVERRST